MQSKIEDDMELAEMPKKIKGRRQRIKAELEEEFRLKKAELDEESRLKKEESKKMWALLENIKKNNGN